MAEWIWLPACVSNRFWTDGIKSLSEASSLKLTRTPHSVSVFIIYWLARKQRQDNVLVTWQRGITKKSQTYCKLDGCHPESGHSRLRLCRHSVVSLDFPAAVSHYHKPLVFSLSRSWLHTRLSSHDSFVLSSFSNSIGNSTRRAQAREKTVSEADWNIDGLPKTRRIIWLGVGGSPSRADSLENATVNVKELFFRRE